MKRPFHPSPRNGAQTLVFFTLAFGTILLLCGLAIDSGLLYLAKARLSRAVDGAVLAAVGNFNLGNPATSNALAITMRNFSVANYTDLSPISSTPTPTLGTYDASALTYTYLFSDGTQDANGQYKRYIQVILKTGSGGQITSATCNARCPARTYFMGVAGAFFKDLKVSSSAVATRNPRLIMVVVDRSSSMLFSNGGAYGLPAAIVTFLNFFDTTSDNIGLVSFSSNARLEMPLTTNFLYAGTNVLYDTYQINTNTEAEGWGDFGIPGVDPEAYTNSDYVTAGIRRMKFGGTTAADEGIRMALEQMMANPGFNNPDINKYLVIFTDGAWNNTRTLVAAPGYTNVTVLPPVSIGTYVTNSAVSCTVPALSPYVDWTNAITDSNDGTFHYDHHTNDIWMSLDGTTNESDPLSSNGPTGIQATHTPGSQGLPIWPPTGATAVQNGSIEGQPMTITNYPYMGTNAAGLSVYSTMLDVWLQPGAVDYVYNGSGQITGTYVSNLNQPNLEQTVTFPANGSNVLVVPGYLIDGNISDTLDLKSGISPPIPHYYRPDGFQVPYMWPDDQNLPYTNVDYVDDGGFDGNYAVSSTDRDLIFRNYINLMTGYFIFRADDPLQTQTSTLGFEPLIKDYSAYPNGYPRAFYGLGPYYPSSGFYFPFDLVGLNSFFNFMLVTPTGDPSGSQNDPHARNIAWSINMLSTNAAPNWAGELFYGGSGGTNDFSGTSAASTQIQDGSTWTIGAPGWLSSFINTGLSSGILLDDPTHYGSSSTNNINGYVLRPTTFIGNLIGTTNSGVAALVAANPSATGGYVQDNNGNVYNNSMAYAGRPTHYYDFSTSQWKAIWDNHIGQDGSNGLALGLGNWKSREYAWHARAAGVTIYTVGYGGAVSDDECVTLAKVANATNVMLTSGVSTNFLSSSYNSEQPIGQEYYATTTNDISNDFYTIGTAINAALTQ